MYAAMMINFEVINVLWQIYNLSDRSEEVRRQKRGAIIILGMLSLEDNQIAIKGFDSLLNIGLGDEGKDDLILGRYTCIALQRVIPADAKKNSTMVKIPREEEAITKFKQILIDYNENPEWYSISEEAIDAIFNSRRSQTGFVRMSSKLKQLLFSVTIELLWKIRMLHYLSCYLLLGM